MADYNSDRTGSNIDLTLDKVDALDAKVQPTATGVDVTGTITADGLTVEGSTGITVRNDAAGANEPKLVFDNDTFAGANHAQIQTGNGGLQLLIESPSTSTFQNRHQILMNGGGGDDVTFRLSTDNGSTYKNQLKIDNNDVLFYEDTGTTAKMVWSSSTESLGIGTASPNEKLQVDGNIRIGDTATGINDNEEYSITSGGQLIISANDSASDTSYTGLILNAGKSGGAAASSSAVVLQTNNTERARIDSSGNLLVGKTSSAVGSAGAELQSGAGANAAIIGTASVQPLILNRLSTDGDIAQFRKDGATVGSIGTDSGNILQLNSGGNDKGVFLARNGSNVVGFAPNEPDVFRPATFDTCDLGKSDRRFKDLYLSGGVYLGGTGAANKLDDYEEGNWTPAASSNVTVDSVQNAQYTKVGNLVNIQAWIKVSITASNPVLVGLPFSISGRTEASISNASVGEVISSQALATSIFLYGATTGGTTEDMFINFSYVTA